MPEIQVTVTNERPIIQLKVIRTETPIRLLKVGVPGGEPGPPGIQGPQGPQGQTGTGGDLTYVHYQSQASDTWLVIHNLGKRPNVTVEDSGGNEVVGNVQNDITDPMNKLTIFFTAAFGGKAFLN